MAAAAFEPAALLIFLLHTAFYGAAATWCVVRSEASDQALQLALDYACGAGADCAPLHSNGLCYLPNTLQAHASYAFNSFYQRKAQAPGACSFGGIATIATTDPSYGSCVYPSSPSNAGMPAGSGGNPAGATTSGATPITTEPLAPPGNTSSFGGTSGGALNPDQGSVFSDSSTASQGLPEVAIFSHIALLLIFWLTFHTMWCAPSDCGNIGI